MHNILVLLKDCAVKAHTLQIIVQGSGLLVLVINIKFMSDWLSDKMWYICHVIWLIDATAVTEEIVMNF